MLFYWVKKLLDLYRTLSINVAILFSLFDFSQYHKQINQNKFNKVSLSMKKTFTSILFLIDLLAPSVILSFEAIKILVM